MTDKNLARIAILLAIAVVVQQLRILLPIPTPITTLMIGTIVNCILILAVQFTSLSWALRLALVLPCIAFVQGHLFATFQIPIVFISNGLYVWVYSKLQKKSVLIIAPLVKTLAMAVGIVIVVKLFGMDNRIISNLIFIMCWAQFITGILGLALARVIDNRMEGYNKNKRPSAS